MGKRIIVQDQIEYQISMLKTLSGNGGYKGTQSSLKTVLEDINASLGKELRGNYVKQINSINKDFATICDRADATQNILQTCRNTFTNLDQELRQEVNNGNLDQSVTNGGYSIPTDGATTDQGFYEKKMADAIADELQNINSSYASKYWSWWYGKNSSRGDSWCAVFCSYMLAKAGIDTKAPANSDSAYKWFETSPAYQKKYFEDNGLFKPKGTYTPKAGDLVYYTNRNGAVVHVGLVTSVVDGKVKTVQGNVGRSTIYEMDETYYRDTNGDCIIAGYADIEAFAKMQNS